MHCTLKNGEREKEPQPEEQVKIYLACIHYVLDTHEPVHLLFLLIMLYFLLFSFFSLALSPVHTVWTTVWNYFKCFAIHPVQAFGGILGKVKVREMNSIFCWNSQSVRVTGAYIKTRLNPMGRKEDNTAMGRNLFQPSAPYVMGEKVRERQREIQGKRKSGYWRERQTEGVRGREGDRNRGETSQKIEKTTVSACQRGMSWRSGINGESRAQCGGGRAWIDRKSNRMKQNERKVRRKVQQMSDKVSGGSRAVHNTS